MSDSLKRSKASESSTATKKRRLVYLDVEAEVSEDEVGQRGNADEEEEEEEDGKLADLIDDSEVSSSNQHRVPPLHAHNDTPSYLISVIEKYNRSSLPSSSIAVSSTASPSAHTLSSSTTPSRLTSATIKACCDVLRSYAQSTLNLHSAETQLEVLLGHPPDAVWHTELSAMIGVEDEEQLPKLLENISAFERKQIGTVSTAFHSATSSTSTTAASTSSPSHERSRSISPPPSAADEDTAEIDEVDPALLSAVDLLVGTFLQENGGRDWSWFAMQCFKGMERSMYRRLQKSPQHLIRNVAFTPGSGLVHVQVRNWNSNNHPLAVHLSQFHGLVYRHKQGSAMPVDSNLPLPKDNPRLELPIATLVPDYVPPSTFSDTPSLFYGDWVKVLAKGPYAGDVGVVFWRGEDPKRMRLLMLERVDSGNRTQLFKKVHDQADVRRLCLECWEDREGSECQHSDGKCMVDVVEMNQVEKWYNGGLAVVDFHVSQLEPANYVSPAWEVSFFQSSSAVLREIDVLQGLPPRSTWQFFENEEVYVIAPEWEDPSTDNSFGAPRSATIIEFIDHLQCRVEVNGNDGIFSRRRIRKKVSLGDEVEILPEIGSESDSQRCGLVVGVNTKDWCAWVNVNVSTGENIAVDVNQLRVIPHIEQQDIHPDDVQTYHSRTRILSKVPEPTAPGLKTHVIDFEARCRRFAGTKIDSFTGQGPWVGRKVVITGKHNERKGERGIVQGVQRGFDPHDAPSSRPRNGLLVHVLLETANSTRSPFLLIDYHWVRHESTLRFLHDEGAHPRLPAGFWAFDPNYCPKYTEQEAAVINRGPHWVDPRMEAQMMRHKADVEQREREAQAAQLHDRRMKLLTREWQEQQARRTPLPSERFASDGGAWDPRSEIEGTSSSASSSIAAPVSTLPAEPTSHFLERTDLFTVLLGILDVWVCHSLTGKDHRVYLDKIGSRVVIRAGKRLRPSATGDLIPSELITQSFTYVPERIALARGLFIVVKGEHVGKIGRRISRRLNTTTSSYDYWLQRVVITPINGLNWSESLPQQEELFQVARSGLAAIHTTEAQNVAGNQLVESTRRRWDYL